jgi:hypothetical protein
MLMPSRVSTVPLGRYGNFFADQLIGKLYGKRFEVQNKLLAELPPLTVEDIGLSLVHPCVLVPC